MCVTQLRWFVKMQNPLESPTVLQSDDWNRPPLPPKLTVPHSRPCLSHRPLSKSFQAPAPFTLRITRPHHLLPVFPCAFLLFSRAHLITNPSNSSVSLQREAHLASSSHLKPVPPTEQFTSTVSAGSCCIYALVLFFNIYLSV